MSFILDEAKRIAHLFDYPAEQVYRGVTEYIRQSDEGLTQENTTLSQIPTFVTSVPNGTEKVRFLSYEVSIPLTRRSFIGPLPRRRPRWHQFSCVLN